MMYYVIYRNDVTMRHTIISGPHHCVQDAAMNRQVSGDLVVDNDYKPVADTSWLWDWEKADPESYAQRAIRGGRASRN